MHFTLFSSHPFCSLYLSSNVAN